MSERNLNEPRRGRHHRDEEDGNAIGLTRAFDPVGEGFDDEDPFAEPEEMPSRRGRHARHAKGSSEAGALDDAFASTDDVSELEVLSAPASEEAEPAGKRRRKHAADEMPSYMRKSRRTRSILMVAIGLLVVFALVGGYFVVQLVQTAQDAADEMAAGDAAASAEIEGEASDDATTVSAKKVSAPDLVALLGLSADAALAQLGEGAQVSSTVEMNAEGRRVAEDEQVASTEYVVSLTADASDVRMGYPSVYLTADAKGDIVLAGFSTTTSLLGFGSQSFEDVVTNGRIIEETLSEAGVSVPADSVSLPADQAAYTTYAEDGTTLVKEHCSFSGEAEAGDSAVQWSAVLSYDYTMYNVTKNLGDTVRVIYVYVE